MDFVEVAGKKIDQAEDLKARAFAKLLENGISGILVFWKPPEPFWKNCPIGISVLLGYLE